MSVVAHVGDNEGRLPIGRWLRPLYAVRVDNVVRAVALHPPVGEAPAIRREGRTQLMDAICLAADDAAGLAVERDEPDVAVAIEAA